MSAPVISTVCAACGQDSTHGVCACTREWDQRGERVIDPAAIGCPCCGETPWCGPAAAEAMSDWDAAPSLAMGTAFYGGRR